MKKFNRISWILVAILVLTAFFEVTNLSANTNNFSDNDRYLITEKDVEIYDNRSGSLEVVGTLKAGQVFPRSEASPSWHTIQFSNFTAYVKKEHTKPYNGSVKDDNFGNYQLSARKLTALRDVTVYGKTNGYLEKMGTIEKGQTYTIVNDYGGEWIYISFANRTGYVKTSEVRKSFLKNDKYLKPLENNVPVYDNRSGALKVVGYLKEHQEYPRGDASSSWHYIQYDDFKGYVRKNQTTQTYGKTIKDENYGNYKLEEENIMASKDVDIYFRGYNGLEPMATIKAGQTYSIVNDYGGDWIYVSFANRTGFVRSSDVRKEFTQNDKFFKTTESNVPVYDNRSGSLKVVGYLDKGEEYPRYEASPKWHYIQFGDFNGFVEKKHTTPSNGVTINNLNNGKYKNDDQLIELIEDTPVYEKTSNGLKRFATLKKGSEYPVALNYGGDWIYVVLADRVGFVRTSDVNIIGEETTYTNYDITYSNFLSRQMSRNPQTDKYRNDPAYVHSDYISVNEGTVINEDSVRLRTDPNDSSDESIFATVNAGTPVKVLGNTKGFEYQGSTEWYEIEYDGEKPLYVHTNLVSTNQKTGVVSNTTSLNVRQQATINSHKFGVLSRGEEVNILDQVNTDQGTWYKISYKTWRTAKESDVRVYLNPDEQDSFQHLLLSSSTGASAKELNNILSGKEILNGKGQAFIDGGKMHKVNEIYLISHALLETGHGGSKLANGIEVGIDKNGNHQLATNSNRDSLSNIKTAYNMFGIAAYDNTALRDGAIHAYKQGWYTPEKAIIGGAKFIGQRYIHNDYKQNTLYKMRWNPAAPGTHQYATDIGWAYKQISIFKAEYAKLSNPTYYYDIPKFK